MPLACLLVLAVLQGVGEFLPISSSGHLTIGQALISAAGGELPDDAVAVNIALHLGTLGSILVVYWRRVGRLLGADRRVIGLLIVGTLPAACLGLAFKPALENALSSPLVAGALLPVTGLILLWSSRRPHGDVSYLEMSWRQALLVGLAQACALLPGISRSGSTIAAGLCVGLRRDSAATFSFLLAIPAILGAGILESAHLGQGSADDAWQLAVAGLAAFAVGIVSLLWLNRWLERGRLAWFAWWCIPFGLAVVVWQLTLRW